MTEFMETDLERVVHALRTSDDPEAKALTVEGIERVVVALENPNFRWRTVRGIAKETGLSEDAVLVALTAIQNWVIRSSIPSARGEDLYTTREHFKKSGSFLERLRGVILNRAS